MMPEWLIDDTADVGEARIFCIHTREPRFIGELLPDDEAPIEGSVFSAPNGQTLCKIEWWDEASFSDEEASAMCRSLAASLKAHEAVRVPPRPPASVRRPAGPRERTGCGLRGIAARIYFSLPSNASRKKLWLVGNRRLELITRKRNAPK